MAKQIEIQEHPLQPPPSDQEISDYAILFNVSEVDAEVALLKEREEAIAAEKADPFNCGYEPPIWKAADALLRLPNMDPHWEAVCRRRWNMSADDVAKLFCEKLGFKSRVTNLLIMGANRSSKSEWTAKRGVMVMSQRSAQKVVWFHHTEPRSIEDQQPLIYKYLPVNLKKDTRTAKAYMVYSEHNGFSNNSFILPNSSKGFFRFYKQDRDDALQGIEPDAAFPDELVPEDWVQYLKVRVGTRDGFVVTSFTPVEGYSPTVKAYCDGMEILMSSIGYCLPVDGQPLMMAEALGLTQKELEITLDYKERKILPSIPRCRAEDIFGMVLDQNRIDGGELPVGRSFDRVPRIARGYEPGTAIIWFHGRDNPYGNPLRVMADAVNDNRGRDWILPIVYGVATKAHGAIFSKFRKNIHTVKDELIPKIGTNYHFLDPHPNRNWFMGWIRADRDGKNWSYREWPGNYEIPGIGVPESWAKPSGRKNGRNDGDKGGGQDPMGFGFIRYKFEIARVEGWEDYKRWQHDNPSEIMASNEEVMEWDEANGSVDAVYRRYIDPRAGAAPSVRDEGSKTLLDELEDVGLVFSQAPGLSVMTGTDALTNALSYNDQKEIDYLNSPRHHIAESCKNTIFAVENYQGVEADKGAMKEPIDLLRWFYMLRCEYVERKEDEGQPDDIDGRERMRQHGKHPYVRRPAPPKQEGDGYARASF